MQRGRVGGVEPNGAAIHVRERHYSSSTKPDEYKGHTHSDDVSLSYELGSVGREIKLPKRCLMNPQRRGMRRSKISSNRCFPDLKFIPYGVHRVRICRVRDQASKITPGGVDLGRSSGHIG